MLKFVVRRLILLIPILFGLSIFIFLFIHALPGDPASALLGERGTPEAVERLRQQLGLDRPIWDQYLSFIGSYATGDLGSSVRSRQPIIDEILLYFRPPLSSRSSQSCLRPHLAFRWASSRRSGVARRSTASPDPVVDRNQHPDLLPWPCLEVRLLGPAGLVPSVGRYDLREYADIPTITNLRTVDCLLAASPGCFGDAVSHLILPAITLGSIPLAIIARITRSSVVEVLNEDYVRTAHAKGLGARTIDRRHVLRNAMIPIATVIGLQAGLCSRAPSLTERVFAWGGIGTWLYSGLSAKDYPVILAGILFLAILFVLVNLAVDVWYVPQSAFATRAERMI